MAAGRLANFHGWKSSARRPRYGIFSRAGGLVRPAGARYSLPVTQTQLYEPVQASFLGLFGGCRLAGAPWETCRDARRPFHRRMSATHSGKRVKFHPPPNYQTGTATPRLV
ncbi:hypothetical protein Bbelb_007200 [Branchiostoma belcheri]|nr:hypothetical protein Bbelb_007200 [Branchiostoma belcheri]